VLILVSFAASLDPKLGSFERRQAYLNESALRHGFDRVISWNWTRIRRTAFYWRTRSVFRHQRGAGYWAWKPYVIHRALVRAPAGAIIVYSDVGRGSGAEPDRGICFRRDIAPLVQWCREQGDGILPGVYIPQHGLNRHWTKRDCFVRMGCDGPAYWEQPQVQAAYSLWQRDERSLAIVRDWMNYCRDPRTVTDQPNTCGLPNLDGFIAHRHDQSILTNLVVRYGLRVPGDPRTETPWSRDINVLADRLEAGARPPDPGAAQATMKGRA